MGNYDLAYKLLHDIILFMIPKSRLVSVLEALIPLITNYMYDYKEFEEHERLTALDEILIDEWQKVIPNEPYHGEDT